MKYLIWAIVICFNMTTVNAKDLLIVGANWCDHCKSLKSYIANNPNLTKKYDVEYLDIDDHPELKEQLKIQAYPSSFIFDDNKRLISTIKGFNKQQFSEWIKNNE